MDRWLTPIHAGEFVDVLPMLQGGRFGPGRRAHDLCARVEQLLCDPAARPAVEAGAESPSRSVRRACVQLLVDLGGDVALLDRVIRTHDVVAIAIVAAAIPTMGTSNRPTGEILFQSPMARFRSEGLWRLTKSDAPGSEDLVRSSLPDSAPSVREVAQALDGEARLRPSCRVPLDARHRPALSHARPRRSPDS